MFTMIPHGVINVTARFPIIHRTVTFVNIFTMFVCLAVYLKFYMSISNNISADLISQRTLKKNKLCERNMVSFVKGEKKNCDTGW